MTEVAKVEKPGAVVAVGGASDFEGDVSDILIPKLLIGQATTKLVQDEKVGFGQVWKSTNAQILGGKGKPFQVIPLSHTKTWILSEKVGAKFEFRGVEPFTSANKDKPWTWSDAKEGKTTEWKREQALNFYVLIPDEIFNDQAARKAFKEKGELPDTEASLLPCLLQFKSTSYKAGKTLVTHFARAADFGVPPYVNAFNIDTEKVTGDSNSWFVFTAAGAGKTNAEYMGVCEKWRNLVKTKSVKIDESDLEDMGAGAPVAEPELTRNIF